MSQAIELADHASYIADTARVSNSMLKVFRQSPALYRGRFVTRTIPSPEPSKQIILGTVLHLSLESETWRERLAIEPLLAPDKTKWYRRKGSDHERWWAEWEASCVGKYQLSDEEITRVCGMQQALLEDPIAGPLLSTRGAHEQTITWTDSETGLPCKCRLDLLPESPPCILDIKSASDPSPDGFNRAVERYGYAHQQEHYRAGVADATGGEIPDFVFLVVGNEPPHDVLAVRLDADWQAIARDDNRRDLRRLADCYAFDQWHAPTWGRINVLSPPGWRLKQWEDE